MIKQKVFSLAKLDTLEYRKLKIYQSWRFDATHVVACKHSLHIFCVAFSLLFFAFCPVANAKAPEFIIKLGTIAPAVSPWGKVSAGYEKQIEAKTNKRVDIQVFYGGQLGTELSTLQQVQSGTIQAAALTSGALATIAPELQIFELPYLFQDSDEARYVIDKVITPQMTKKLLPKGLYSTAVAENGFHNIITTKPIHTPDDFKGLKFASQESKLHLLFWKSLGVNAIPVPDLDAFSVMQRNVVDGTAQSVLAILALSLATRKKHITISEHMYQAGIVVINKKYWDTIPKDLQTTMQNQNEEIARAMREEMTKSEKDGIRMLKAINVKFYYMTDDEKKEFVKKTKIVYNQLKDEIGEKFLKDVLETRDKYRKEKK